MNLMKFLRWVSISLFLCASGLNASPSVYVCSADSKNVEVIDHATGTVTATLSVAGEPVKAVSALDGISVFVADATGRVTVFSTILNIPIATISLPLGGIPSDLALSPDGKYLHVTLSGGTHVVINTTTYHTLQVISNVGINSTVALSPDGHSLYIANKILNSIAVYTRDAVTGLFSLTTTLTAGLHAPSGIVFKSDGTLFYVINVANKSVSVVDAVSLNIVNTAALSAKPLAIAITPDGNSLYVTLGDDKDDSCSAGSITVISTLDFSTPAAIRVGHCPNHLVFTKDGKFAYVTDLSGHSVYLVDAALLKVSATIDVGHTSNGISISKGTL